MTDDIVTAGKAPSRFDPDRLKAGPAPRDLADIRPADIEAWKQDAVVVKPRPAHARSKPFAAE